MTLARFFRLIEYVLYILEGAVFLYALLSWFRPNFNFYRWLENIVSPILVPFRYLNDLLFGRAHLPVDLTCVLAILGLQLVNSLWWRLYLLLRTLRGR